MTSQASGGNATPSPLPTDVSNNVGTILSQSFEDLLKELGGSITLTPVQTASLRDALAAIVRGQVQLVAGEINNDQGDQVRRTMRSAMNTIELVAEAKAFSAATITRRYAWNVFDRLLVAGVGLIGS